jgi:hypothetical protein
MASAARVLCETQPTTGTVPINSASFRAFVDQKKSEQYTHHKTQGNPNRTTMQYVALDFSDAVLVKAKDNKWFCFPPFVDHFLIPTCEEVLAFSKTEESKPKSIEEITFWDPNQDVLRYVIDMWVFAQDNSAAKTKQMAQFWTALIDQAEQFANLGTEDPNAKRDRAQTLWKWAAIQNNMACFLTLKKETAPVVAGSLAESFECDLQRHIKRIQNNRQVLFPKMIEFVDDCLRKVAEAMGSCNRMRYVCAPQGGYSKVAKVLKVEPEPKLLEEFPDQYDPMWSLAINKSTMWKMFQHCLVKMVHIPQAEFPALEVRVFTE